MKTFEISKDIKNLIEEIDVSDTDYEKATSRYNSISSYIHESELSKYSPDIFLQGSIKLGTAVKPLAEDGSYDIDIVCNFTKKRRQHQSQKSLKKEIGRIIKNYSYSNNMKNAPSESSRCWTLNYIDESNFHIDILPSVPWNDYEDGTIAISDTRNLDYERISSNWEISNPKGYSEWFREQSSFKILKESYAKRFYASIEKIPDYMIKTPLQRIVQILKRHAEVLFEDNIEFKPSSVIITTLAAKAYPESTFLSADFKELLIVVIKKLTNGIEYDGEKPCVLNPINRNEKLSLKWDKDVEYFNSFIRWIEQLRTDFSVDNNEMDSEDRVFYMRRSLHKAKNEVGVSLDSLYHHQKSKWINSSVISEYVEIKAYYSWNNFRFKGIKSGEALNKKGELRFEVKTTNLKDYDIYWQITNSGYEANQANCLRGDFYDSKIELGKKVRTESTSFIGRHYVEAYLVKNNICYGKSKPFEVNITEGIKFGWFKR